MTKTRLQLEEEFDIDARGIITNPCKFEGESLATPFYYDLMLDGEGDIIEIESSDRSAFDIEDRYNFVLVLESNDGFISLAYFEDRESAQKESDNQYIMDSIDLDSYDFDS